MDFNADCPGNSSSWLNLDSSNLTNSFIARKAKNASGQDGKWKRKKLIWTTASNCFRRILIPRARRFLVTWSGAETASEPSGKREGLLWVHAKKIHFSIGGWGGLLESARRTKNRIEEEIAAANSNLQVKGAPAHPVSSIRGGSAPK